MTNAHDERGSVTIWIVTATFVMMTMVGLAVDLGGKVHAQQRAHSLAAQAARAGAQEVQGTPAVEGRYVAVDFQLARAAALQYLQAAGVTGTVAASAGDTITVTVTDTYRPRVLDALSVGPWDVAGTASARVIRTVDGAEQ